MKEKIRHIYNELQGYLAQASKIDKSSIYKEEAVALGNQLTGVIQELNELTGENYNKFKAEAFSEEMNRSRILTLDLSVYRLRLGGLISRIYGKYFFDENPPFSEMPTTVINQNQHQNQSIQMILEIQSKIDHELQKAPEGSKEKTFLEKIKSSLSSITNVSQLMALIVKTAQELGITTDQLYQFFH